MNNQSFRFMDLEVWEIATEIGDELYDIADKLEKKNKYRFSEQLRGAALSISNNIAESSGCSSDREFSRFLRIARRSAFENVNMLKVFEQRKLIDSNTFKEITNKIEHLSRKITSHQRSLEK